MHPESAPIHRLPLGTFHLVHLTVSFLETLLPHLETIEPCRKYTQDLERATVRRRSPMTCDDARGTGYNHLSGHGSRRPMAAELFEAAFSIGYCHDRLNFSVPGSPQIKVIHSNCTSNATHLLPLSASLSIFHLRLRHAGHA